MADLAQALDAALTDRFPIPEVKRPVSHRQGLTTRMNRLEKAFARPGDRKGSAAVRAAKAAGISPRQWERWRKGEAKPGPRLTQKLEGAFARYIQQPAARKRINATGAPNRVTVTAEVNWNGYHNRTEQRTVKLLGMRAVMVRTIRAWATAGPQAAAEVFQEGAAQVHNTGYIQFEGDRVEVEFP